MVNKTKKYFIHFVQHEIVGNLGYNTVINQSKCCTDKPTTLSAVLIMMYFGLIDLSSNYVTANTVFNLAPP